MTPLHLTSPSHLSLVPISQLQLRRAQWKTAWQYSTCILEGWPLGHTFPEVSICDLWIWASISSHLRFSFREEEVGKAAEGMESKGWRAKGIVSEKICTRRWYLPTVRLAGERKAQGNRLSLGLQFLLKWFSDLQWGLLWLPVQATSWQLWRGSVPLTRTQYVGC